MKVRADKISKGGICTEKAGDMLEVNYPLTIWDAKSGLDYNTGKGSHVMPVQNFGGIKYGDLLHGKTARGERDYYLAITDSTQDFSSKTIKFSFLCYCDELKKRIN